VIEGTASVQPTESQRALLLRNRVGDVRFVLDALIARSRARAGVLAGRIATDKIGALGHSLGGATSAAAMLADPRIRSGVDLDGTILGAVAASGLGRPFMLIVGDHFSGGLAPDQEQFFRRLRSTRYAITLAGAGHYNFTDLPLFAAALAGLDQAFDIGTIEPTRAQAATSAYVAAFFDRTLRECRTPLLDGPSAAYPEARFIAAERKPTILARRSDATPVGALPRARVTTVLTHPGSLVAVALRRAAASTGLVWRLARRLDASIVPQVSEANIGPSVVVVFRARRVGRAQIVFALTRGESSPKALRAVKYVVQIRRAQK
jgi:dienelactone hydrolase